MTLMPFAYFGNRWERINSNSLVEAFISDAPLTIRATTDECAES